MEMEKILRVIISRLNKAERHRAYHRSLLFTDIPDDEYNYHERQMVKFRAKKNELLGILRECGVNYKSTAHTLCVAHGHGEATVEYVNEYEIIDSADSESD